MRIRGWKFCADALNFAFESQGMCWQRKMHQGILEVSLRDFDEELCLGFSRVCKDWQTIRLQDLDINGDLAFEMRDLSELHLARQYTGSDGDYQRYDANIAQAMFAVVFGEFQN